MGVGVADTDVVGVGVGLLVAIAVGLGFATGLSDWGRNNQFTNAQDANPVTNTSPIPTAVTDQGSSHSDRADTSSSAARGTLSPLPPATEVLPNPKASVLGAGRPKATVLAVDAGPAPAELGDRGAVLGTGYPDELWD